MAITKAGNHGPTGLRAKECTDSTIPLRVMNVPKMESANAAMMSITFHTLKIPRRSWTMTECKNAVAASQGMNDAFSTGSQAQ